MKNIAFAANFILAMFLATNASADGVGEPRISQPKLRQGTMTCTPSNIRSNQSFAIRLPERFGPDLAIVDPNGRYFFLSFRPSETAPKHLPVISEQALHSQNLLVIHTTKTKGVELAIGSNGAPQRIFTKNGIYRVLISDSLETEDPVLDGWCEVFFNK